MGGYDVLITQAINTDAHHTDTLRTMRFGVTRTHRGGPGKGDSFNCCTLAARRMKIAGKRG